MTKLLCVLACVLVAWDCAEKALGVEPSVIIGADYLWLWWGAALGWSIVAAKAIFTRFYTA